MERKKIVLILMSLFVFSLTHAGVTYYSALDFQKEMVLNKQSLIIDVRTSDEFSSGHIKQAKNVNVEDDEFIDKIKKLSRRNEVLLYCRTGHRTEMARGILEKLGYKNLGILKGGIQTWIKAGLPLEEQ